MIVANDNLSVTFESLHDIDLQNIDALECMTHLGLMNNDIPLETLNLTLLGSGIYRFEFTDKRGRSWKQRLSVETPVDRMTFNGNVNDFWDLGELPHIWVIRDHLFRLMRTPPTLISVEAVWDGVLP